MTTSLVAITGNTYPVKEQLKALGARWNAEQKVWMVAENKAAEAQKLVTAAGPKKSFAPIARTFVARRAWAHVHSGGVGYCGARGCGAGGCPDCRD